MRLFFKRILALAFLTLFTSVVSAQVTGKFGTYYDQRDFPDDWHQRHELGL